MSSVAGCLIIIGAFLATYKACTVCIKNNNGFMNSLRNANPRTAAECVGMRFRKKKKRQQDESDDEEVFPLITIHRASPSMENLHPIQIEEEEQAVQIEQQPPQVTGADDDGGDTLRVPDDDGTGKKTPPPPSDAAPTSPPTTTTTTTPPPSLIPTETKEKSGSSADQLDGLLDEAASMAQNITNN